MMPWQHFGRTSSLCCEAAALNPDAPRGLCVLHVFAAATGWAKSTLLPTSLDSRVQIRPFCPRRPSLILSRTAARTASKACSAQGASQFAVGYAAVRRAASHDSICSHKSLRKRLRGYVLTGLLLLGKTEQPEIHTAGESVDSLLFS